MKRLIIIFLTLAIPLAIFAQIDTEATANRVIENIIEQIVQSQELEQADFNDIFDDLYFFYQHKINLNTATAQQLERLHFLDDNQIYAILDYRHKTGYFISIYELQLIPNLSRQDIEMLLPFVTVEKIEKTPPLKLSNVLKWGRNQLIIRSKTIQPTPVGYLLPDTVPTRYLGDNYALYVRYRFTFSNRILAGFTAEKDQGEEFFTGTQKQGFDFYSAHLQINQLTKHIDRIVIGDFQGRFGQGLVLWNGFAMGKSAYVLKIRRQPQGLRKYSSTDENRFFRGLGITAKFGDFYLSTFASYKKIDANLQFDTVEQISLYASSLLNTGYHRTLSEIQDKDAIAEQVAGLDLTYKGKKWHVGITGIGYRWSVPLLQENTIYRLNPYRKNYGANIGFNWFYMSHRLSFFGEAASDIDANPALLAGLSLPMNYRLEAVVLYRYFSVNYFPYYANAFSEATLPQNEQGFYTGLRILPLKNWQLSLYFDTYKFMWMRYRLYEPQTNGNDFFAQIDFTPNRRFSAYLRFKTELKPQNFSADTLKNPLILPTETTKLRLHLSYNLTSGITLRTRAEWSRYRQIQTQNGFLVYQDVKFTFNRLPLTFYTRIALFDAPYNARIYAYENDVLYAFSVPAYFYKGLRFYLLAKYQPNRRITFWLRYAQTTYTDRNIISEGSLNQINSNYKAEIKLQMLIRI